MYSIGGHGADSPDQIKGDIERAHSLTNRHLAFCLDCIVHIQWNR